MYRDPELPRFWYALLALMFVLAIAPNLGLSELSEGEANWALTVRHIAMNGQWVDARPPGTESMVWPLQSWIAVPLTWHSTVSPTVLRILAMLPVLAVAAMSGWVARRVAGPTAGAVSAAIVMFSFPMLQEGVYGSGSSLFPCLINAAWLTWFYYIRENRNWLFAWFFSLGLAGLGMLVVGPAALLFFYLPLFFLSRPLRPWRRIILWQHWVSLALLVAAALLWIAMAPGYRQIDGIDLSGGGGSYLLRLLTFPVVAAAMYMPWLLVTWPAFCAAFTPLEPARALGRYLRTIVFAVFGVSWLMPEAGMTYLQVLIGPLAILAGMHYPLLMRRYARQMRLLPKLLSIVAVIVVVGGFLIVILMKAGVYGDGVTPTVLRNTLISLGLGIAIAFLSVGMKRRWPLWALVVCGVVALQAARSGALHVLADSDGEHRKTAESLIVGVPEGATIRINRNSQAGEAVSPGPIVAYYLQRHLVNMTTPYDVGQETPVYVLQQNHTPRNRFRVWTPLGLPTQVGTQRLRMWLGDAATQAPVPPPDREPPLPTLPLILPSPDSPTITPP